MLKRSNLILLIFALALVALAYWLVNNPESETIATPTAAPTPERAFDVATEEINGILIEDTLNQKTVQLQLESPDSWQIVQPEAQPADLGAVSLLLSNINGLLSYSNISDATDFAQFGLADAPLKLTITTSGGATSTLLIGNQVPTGGSYYAKHPDQNMVMVISETLVQSLINTAANPPVQPTPTPAAAGPVATPTP